MKISAHDEWQKDVYFNDADSLRHATGFPHVFAPNTIVRPRHSRAAKEEFPLLRENADFQFLVAGWRYG